MNLLATELTRHILSHPFFLCWEIQGLGVMRARLSKDLRLHVWHSDLKTVHTSDKHNHPWWLESYVVAGRIEEKVYGTIWNLDRSYGDLHTARKIVTGVGDPVEEDCKVFLPSCEERLHFAGFSYVLSPIWIHRTHFVDGTVTLCRSFDRVEDGTAYVFWPADQEFQSAAPRPATSLEIKKYTTLALSNFN